MQQTEIRLSLLSIIGFGALAYLFSIVSLSPFLKTPFLFIYFFFLPGFLLYRWFLTPHTDWIETLSVSLVLGIIISPFIQYLVITSTPLSMTLPVMVLVELGFLLLLLLAGIYRHSLERGVEHLISSLYRLLQRFS